MTAKLQLALIVAALLAGCTDAPQQTLQRVEQFSQKVNWVAMLELYTEVAKSEIALREKAVEGWDKARRGEDTNKEIDEYEDLRKKHNELVRQWKATTQ